MLKGYTVPFIQPVLVLSIVGQPAGLNQEPYFERFCGGEIRPFPQRWRRVLRIGSEEHLKLRELNFSDNDMGKSLSIFTREHPVNLGCSKLNWWFVLNRVIKIILTIIKCSRSCFLCIDIFRTFILQVIAMRRHRSWKSITSLN